MANITIRATNFRVIKQLDWQPDGVCLLAGANGAGKTTCLDMLLFLRTLFEWGHENAFLVVGGGSYFRRLGITEEETVNFEVEVENIVWKLRFPMSDHGIKGIYAEELICDNKLILRAGLFEETWQLGSERLPLDEKRCCAKVLWDRGKSDWMRPLASALSGIRIFKSFPLNQVQKPETVSESISYLRRTGNNLWSVLATWKTAPIRYGGQFEWVMSEARKAFPDIMGTVEIDRGQPYLFPPNSTDFADGLPPSRAADGLLTGLLQLTAVAGARPGSIIAFDEMENQLHPHAIRSLLNSMRMQANERNLTIIVTTHSPVVMNTFRREPEHFFVLQRGVEHNPTPLTELHDEDWLAAFSLGDLYDRLDFAAPDLNRLEN